MLESPLKINWYKLNRALHRDLGYFFFGMIIIYALSGIAMNHLDDWNPRYTVETKESIWSGPGLTTPLEEKMPLKFSTCSEKGKGIRNTSHMIRVM